MSLNPDVRPDNPKKMKRQYKDVIVHDCPRQDCLAPAGELCDTPAVWVHLERFNLAYPPH